MTVPTVSNQLKPYVVETSRYDRAMQDRFPNAGVFPDSDTASHTPIRLTKGWLVERRAVAGRDRSILTGRPEHALCDVESGSGDGIQLWRA
jgi:hypothetical protein